MSKHFVNEYLQMKKMLKNIRIIKEQNDPQYQQPTPTNQNSGEQKQSFNIDGSDIVLSTATGQSLELTDDVRTIFTTTKDEFEQQVSDLVNFNPLNVKDNGVEWSGRLTKFDLEYIYIIGSNGGVFIKGEKIKVDDEMTTLLNQLNQYYKNFTQKWSSVITSRQQAKQNGNQNDISSQSS